MSQQLYSTTGTRCKNIFWFETQNLNTPHEIFYWVNKKFHVVYLYFEFQIKKIILILVKSPIDFLLFSSLWIVNTEKISYLLMCFVKRGVLERSLKLPAASKSNCSYCGLIFITWKYNTMKKSRLLSQNSLRQICNVFAFTFIKHLFKRRIVLHIGCIVEKVINHIVLIWAIKFNVKQVKQKPLEVCITWKVVGVLEFYIFPGYKNINRLYGAMA